MKLNLLTYFFLQILLTILLSNSVLKAQTELTHVERTAKTSFRARPADNKEFKKKKVRYIVKNDARKLLLGNKCADEETLKMGFMYVAIPKGHPGNKDQVKRNFNNLGTKTVVFFKNGPFWKLRLKKKIKKCRELTGDFVG